MTMGLPLDPSGPPDIGVAIASGGATWEPPLISQIERHRSGLRLVRRCVDLADLLALCRAGRAGVAIVAADLPRLARDDIASLASAGVTVVVVATDTDRGRELAGSAGRVVASAGAPDDIVAAARTGAQAHADRRSETAHRDASTALRNAAPTGEHAETPPPGRGPGQLVAVMSPAGAPGRTTLAVEMATALARRGTSTMLVDADVNGGAISTALGLIDDTPGLPAACRSAARGRLDRAVLAAHAVAVGEHLRVLSAPARSDRWRELRPSALRTVLGAARGLVDVVVVDCPAGVPSSALDPLHLEPAGPGSTTAAVLEDADVSLLVASADTLGLVRLTHAIEVLDESVPAAATHDHLHVVVNRVRASAAGRSPETHVRRTLDRIAPGRRYTLLPQDVEAADAALRAGRPVGDAAPSSALARAITKLLDDVVPPASISSGAPAHRRWSRRSIA